MLKAQICGFNFGWHNISDPKWFKEGPYLKVISTGCVRWWDRYRDVSCYSIHSVTSRGSQGSSYYAGLRGQPSPIVRTLYRDQHGHLGALLWPIVNRLATPLERPPVGPPE